MKKLLLISLIAFNVSFVAQEEVEEIDPNVERVEKIQDLIDRVEKNSQELARADAARINNFINKVKDRNFLLSKAKKQLSDEEIRNKNLEGLFEANELKLSELETELQIKLGVLGELFGVARQMAGELNADSEAAYNFSEFPNRGSALQEIGKIKITNRTSCCKKRAIGVKAQILAADGTTVVEETPAISTEADTYTFTFPGTTWA